MTYAEEKKLKEEKLKTIANLSDADKLKYLISLLDTEVEMFTDGSDTHGINFTDEYNEMQEKIEEFLEAVNKRRKGEI